MYQEIVSKRDNIGYPDDLTYLDYLVDDLEYLEHLAHLEDLDDLEEISHYVTLSPLYKGLQIWEKESYFQDKGV